MPFKSTLPLLIVCLIPDDVAIELRAVEEELIEEFLICERCAPVEPLRKNIRVRRTCPSGLTNLHFLGSDILYISQRVHDSIDALIRIGAIFIVERMTVDTVEIGGRFDGADIVTDDLPVFTNGDKRRRTFLRKHASRLVCPPEIRSKIHDASGNHLVAHNDDINA